MLFKLNRALFIVLLGSLAANSLPSITSEAKNVVNDLQDLSPIGNPAEIFMNLFKGLTKVVIENISKQQTVDGSEKYEEEPIQKKLQAFSAANAKATIDQVAEQAEEGLQKLKSDVENTTIKVENTIKVITNKTRDLMPQKTPEIMKQVVDKIEAKENEIKSLGQAEVKSISDKVNVIIKKSTIPGEDEVIKTVQTVIEKATSKDEDVKTLINKTINFVDVNKKVKDEDLNKMDAKLQKLEKEIEKNLKLDVFDLQKFQNVKEKFQQDFEDMKEKFVDKLEKFSEGLKTYSEKISENNNNKKVRSTTTQKCIDGKGDDCYYDLDESLSTDVMDTKLVELNKSIMNNLNSSVFEHHKFHRSKSHFIHEYKKAKHAYLMKLNKIAAEINDFVMKAQSKRKDDKATVKKEEDGFLYRNEQSLF